MSWKTEKSYRNMQFKSFWRSGHYFIALRKWLRPYGHQLLKAKHKLIRYQSDKHFFPLKGISDRGVAMFLVAISILVIAVLFSNYSNFLTSTPTEVEFTSQLSGSYVSAPHRSEHGFTQTLTLTTESIPLFQAHDHLGGGTVFGHGNVVTSDIWIAEKDLVVKSAVFKLHNAPKSVIHHLALQDMSLPIDSSCPVHSIFNRSIIAQGSYGSLIDSNASLLKDLIFIKKGTPMMLEAMLHNPFPPYGPGGTYKEVAVSIDLQLAQAPSDFVKKEKIILFFADQCSSPTFKVPPRRDTFTKTGQSLNGQNTGRYSFDKPGDLLLMGAHLHPFEGGQSIKVYLNDTLIHTFMPIEDEYDAWLWSTPPLQDTIHIALGDTISITATYTNFTDQEIPGAMGIVGIIFEPYT